MNTGKSKQIRRVGDGSSCIAAQMLGGRRQWPEGIVGFCTLTCVPMLAGLHLSSRSWTFTLCVLISRSVDKFTLNTWEIQNTMLRVFIPLFFKSELLILSCCCSVSYVVFDSSLLSLIITLNGGGRQEPTCTLNLPVFICRWLQEEEWGWVSLGRESV